MICSKNRETCFLCNGEGRITVNTESMGEHKVSVFLNDGKDYAVPTKKITCYECNGKGKINGPHNYSYSHNAKRKRGGFFSESYVAEIYRCSYCDDEVEVSDNYSGHAKLSKLNSR